LAITSNQGGVPLGSLESKALNFLEYASWNLLFGIGPSRSFLF
jgi:hypothetical protein